MKRIITLIMLVLIAIPCMALEDVTPGGGDDDYLNDDTFDPANAQILAGISQIIKNQESIKQSCDSSFKQADIEKFEEKLDAQFETKIGVILGRMIIILLVWQAFFFATFFLAKSKGWF